MGVQNYRVVPKINGNIIGIYVYMPASGQTRQVALIECPADDQMGDNVELAEAVKNAYKRRLRKSL